MRVFAKTTGLAMLIWGLVYGYLWVFGLVPDLGEDQAVTFVLLTIVGGFVFVFGFMP